MMRVKKRNKVLCLLLSLVMLLALLPSGKTVSVEAAGSTITIDDWAKYGDHYFGLTNGDSLSITAPNDRTREFPFQIVLLLDKSVGGIHEFTIDGNGGTYNNLYIKSDETSPLASGEAEEITIKLTLRNITINAPDEHDPSDLARSAFTVLNDTTLIIDGEVGLKGGDGVSDDGMHGIDSNAAGLDLTIEGSSIEGCTLTATGGDSDNGNGGNGIYTIDGNIRLNTEVNAIGGKGGPSGRGGLSIKIDEPSLRFSRTVSTAAFGFRAMGNTIVLDEYAVLAAKEGTNFDNANYEKISLSPTASLLQGGLVIRYNDTGDIEVFDVSQGSVDIKRSTGGFTIFFVSDINPPTVQNVIPTDGETNVELNGSIFITFSKDMDTSSGGIGTVSLNNVPLLPGIWSNNRTYTVSYSGLSYETEYTMTISDFRDWIWIDMEDYEYASTMFKTKKDPGGTPPIQYTVTVQSEVGGTASASHASASPGTEITLTATPNSGYYFSHWEVTSPSSLVITDNKFSMPAENVIIKSIFAESGTSQYTVTVESALGGMASASHTSAVPGTEIVLTVVPNNGYYFSRWEIISPSDLAIVANKFFMPAENVTIRPVFRIIDSGENTSNRSSNRSNYPPGEGPVSTDGKIIGPNGIIIDPDTIDTSKSPYTINLTPENGSAYLLIPLSALFKLAGENEHFFLEIRTPYGIYMIPVNLAELIPGLSELLEQLGLSFDDLSFRVTLTDRSEDGNVLDAFERGLPNADIMGAIVDFKIEIIYMNTNAPIAEANRFLEAITRIIPMPRDVEDMPRYFGAFRYNENSRSFVFVPHIMTLIDGVWYISINSYTNSIYTVAENNVSFSDVESGSWYSNYVAKAASKLLVRGVGKNLYEPSRSITKAEFVQMMASIMQLAPVDTKSVKAYNDVRKDAWYYDVIMRARAAGLLDSFTESNFKPSQPITREEIATIMAAILSEKGKTTKDAPLEIDQLFVDYDEIDSRYFKDIELVCRMKLLVGVGENRFDPKGATTRAQAAAVQIRLLETLGMIN